MLPDFSENLVHVRYLSLLEDLMLSGHTAGVAAYLDFCIGSCARQLWGFIWLPYLERALVPSDMWWAEVPLICYEIVEYHYPGDGPAIASEVLSYPSDEYIRWYRGITRVYIGSPANCDTSSREYQPAGVNRRMMEVDDMASVVIHQPPTVPSQMAVFVKKMPPPPGLGFASFQAPHSTSFGFSGFHAPPLLGTTGSSTPHQPISQESSSDKEERVDDMDGVQHYGFGHRVGKKTTRFTPSDWP
ncbi:hypothetical protein M9H77_07606 [Catharanthus roseus]|uniref:Uncharacterized protein n=1 Tax=Catharanthus roseus TaxID=4058 RepID=A0ACC0BVI6_CATRO|nr:hypothetical protein M9H77_07606 [Catharanthus roseus]